MPGSGSALEWPDGATHTKEGSMFALIIVGVLLVAMAIGVAPFLLDKSEDETLKWLIASLWIVFVAASLNVIGAVFLV